MLRMFSPVVNLVNRSEESLEIGEDFLIRQASSSELAILKSIYQHDPMLGDLREDYGDNVQVIESLFDPEDLRAYVPFDRFRGSEGEYLKWRERNRDALSRCRRIIESKLAFLRLMKPGQIACKVFLLKETTKEGEHISSLTVRYYTPWYYENYPYKYELSIEEIDHYSSEYGLIGSSISIDESPSLRYFCKGYHEPLLVDRIVDIVIGLESLCLSNERSHTELRYKLAMRCSAYIEEEYKRRGEVCKNVLTAYDLRSKIVHGGEKKKKEKAKKDKAREELKLVFPTIENYLRTSLVKVLKEPRWLEGKDFDRFLLE